MHFNHDNVIPFSTPNQVDRLPPQNIEAEESILGGIMLDPQAINRVSHILIPEAFYVSAHREIYTALTQLHAAGQPTDLLCLSSWLSDHNLLERIGGRNKLATLFDRTVSAVNQTIRNSQFAIRNWGCNLKLIHLGIQAPNFNYVTIQRRNSSSQLQLWVNNCELRIANCELV